LIRLKRYFNINDAEIDKAISRLLDKAELKEIFNQIQKYNSWRNVKMVIITILVCACTENGKDRAGSSGKFQTGMFKAIISGNDITVCKEMIVTVDVIVMIKLILGM